jgi:two-component system chemotaxis sensor kinase CheA
MTPDYSKALETFISEAEELLSEAEQTLVDHESVAIVDAVPAWLDALFRSVHTIKGSAGLFGLDSLVRLSHIVESTLSLIREQKLAVSSDLIGLFIESIDVIRLHLDAISSGEDASANLASRELERRLSQFLPDREETGPSKHSDAAITTSNNERQSQADQGLWHISFRPHPTVFQDGLDPLAFIRYLKNLGQIHTVHVIDDEIEPSKAFDPTLCYLGFEITLESACGREQILEAFDFIANDADIAIIAPNSRVEEYIALIHQLPNGKSKVGEILVRVGALTSAEVEHALAQQKILKDSQQNPPLIGHIFNEESGVAQEVIKAAVTKQKPLLKANKTLRVEANKLDQLIDLVGEMVITGARTNLLAHQTGNEPLIEAMAQLERLVESIRDSSLQLRMVQIGDTFNKYKRVVRDIATEVNKSVDLVVTGGDTELDKTFVEKLSDPLTHLVRNAIDHGLESTADRLDAGKSETGTIRLNAYHDSGAIVIEVGDDGRGIDVNRVSEVAADKGLIEKGTIVNRQELHNVIFEPGFSTKSEVSDLSGRGVGMDVVKKNIDQLRGSIEVESEVGKGTTFVVRLPLTLSIIEGFMFRVSGDNYVVPLDNVVECLELREVVDQDQLGEKHFITLRDEVLPVMRLSEWFKTQSLSEFDNEALVVVQLGSLRAGLIVDELVGEYQTVVKPLGPLFEGLKGVSGATILGSGNVAIILDIFALIHTVISQNEQENTELLKE